MNYIFEELSKWTKNLNPVLQGVLGSALFAIAVWFGRKIYNFLIDLNKDLRIARQYKQVMKIIIHSSFVNSNGMYYFTQGFLLVIFKAMGHLFKGLIFFFVGLGLSSVSNEIFLIIGIYFCVQEIISGLSWLNDKWGSKDLSHYDQTLVKEIQEKLTAHDPLKGDS